MPDQKIVVTHGGVDTEYQTVNLSVDVTLRENKGSDATINLADGAGTLFLNKLDTDDIVQISLKTNPSDSWHQVFGGYIVRPTPAITNRGRTLRCDMYGYDVALDRMRAAIEYGTQSVNPTLDTLKEILTDANKGLIPKWTQKVLNTAVNSGYIFDTSNVLDEPTSLDYLYFPYTPVNSCLKTMLDLITAAKSPNAGLHWTVIPVGTVAYLCIDQICNHTTAAALWPTNCPVTPEIGVNILSETGNKLQREGNYVVYFGKYEWPPGEIMTENAAANWTYAIGAGATKSDSADCKVGANSLKFNLQDVGAGEHAWYYPAGKNLALDITKIGTKRSAPTLGFYVKPVNVSSAKIFLGTGTTFQADYYIKDFTDKLPANGKWGFVELSLGPYLKNTQEDWDVGASTGALNWNKIDYICIDIYRPGMGHTDIYFDDMTVNGIVTRGAYDSTSIAKGCIIKLVTDSLAKTTNLTASDDSGTVAQLAKAELLRARTTPRVGTITLAQLSPTIWPGQKVQVLPSGNYRRITEVKYHLGSDMAVTTLSITDDLTNSYPLEPTSMYNSIMKATNPDFQDRDRGELKARDIDIDQLILAKDYPS